MAQERQRPGIPAHRGRIRPQRRGRAAHRSRLVGIASGAIGACPGVRHVRRQHENRLTSGGTSTDRKDPKPYAREGIIVLEMDNESAAPTARCGAYVGIDTAASHPASGELFAVLLPYEGIILRRLAWDRKEKCFVLRAEKPAYPEIQEDLTGRILGRLAWVMQKV